MLWFCCRAVPAFTNTFGRPRVRRSRRPSSALYRFGDSTALLQLVNPLMWIGLGLFFVTGWVIGWVVERLLRGTAGRFRTLLLGATFLATPVAVAGSLVGGLFGPPGVLLYGLIPYLLLVGIPRLIGVVWTRHGS